MKLYVYEFINHITLIAIRATMTCVSIPEFIKLKFSESERINRMIQDFLVEFSYYNFHKNCNRFQVLGKKDIGHHLK